MPVHWAGQVANMSEIISIAEKYNIAIIEDSAETIGGTHKDRFGGTFGIGCYSFYPGKNMTTAEGGMLTTNNDDLAKKARIIMGHGILKTTFDRHQENNKPWIRSAVREGFNFRMSDVHAAIGVEQFKKLDYMNNQRILNAKLYKNLLKDINEVILPVEKKENKHVWQMFTIKVNPNLRDKLVMYLRSWNIGASVHFDPPVHKMEYFSKIKNSNNLPITDKIYKQLITLPMFPQMKEEQIIYVVDKIENFFSEK